ncbi:MAG: thiamine diphosphokinase [Oscillospiraceae bacterium]|nr:thiamine diphosphokinase [Oscillospiraceae bacterium]
MKPCIIFGAAGFDGLLCPIPDHALTIAADGGLRHTQALGLSPDVILGDFDSLGYVPEDSRVFPVEKDDTDSMLAVRLGLDRGCTEFFLYGGLDGPRLDHTVANFQTLAYLATHGARGWLIGKDTIVTVASRETLSFDDKAEGILSLFALGNAVRDVTITGLHYPLERGTLTPDFPLGVSNHFTGRDASITVGEGLLLMLWDRACGLPRRTGLC